MKSKKKFTKKVLLITDLDNTLVGDDLATKKLNHHLSKHRQHYIVVYATGRSYCSAQKLKSERELLEPDYWVTGVGTEIYAKNYLDLDWAVQISADWQREAIANLVESEFSELKCQVDQEQNPWKLSFQLPDLCHSQSKDNDDNRDLANIKYFDPHPHYLRSNPLDSFVLKERDRFKSKTINQLNIRLQQQQLNAQVIFSSNLDVDILPINANKGNAVVYIQQKLGITSSQTLVCGDSGNDISMFQQPTFGVIVNNAQIELIEWYQIYADKHHYLANSSYASGILEALQKFNLLAV